MRIRLMINLLALSLSAFAGTASAAPSNPILFVTQMPTGEFTAVSMTFGNHRGQPQQAPRGGDLVIRYPDGSLRFLTQEAGYGTSGLQSANSIAVREPCVHWDGTKALFAMAVGGPTQQYQLGQHYFQIYEVTGLGQGETASIRKIAGQPSNFNNVSPIYATDGKILFTSDRPPSGAAHHYPQLDEYESTVTVAGIYSLDEATATLIMLEHAPSGAFSLSLDSFGRVIFTKWDHLQRDQQGDAPATAASYQAVTYASTAANATYTTSLTGAEVFPEPRTQNDPTYSPVLSKHSFNHFFPWEINQDGTAEETLNHIGRQELGGSYTDGSFAADPNLSYYTSPSLHANQLKIAGSAGLFHFREDPTNPGNFFTTYSQEFGTGTGGTLMQLTGAPSVNAESMVLSAITKTSQDAQVPQQTGYFRNPLPLSNGALVAVHTPATGYLTNLGSTSAPNWSYYFRLKELTLQGGFWVPTTNLTNGIQKNLTWWTPDSFASYNGPLWELDPVEVVVRPIPTARTSSLPAIEAGVFSAEDVDVETFRSFLRDNGLALIVSRNVTQRDRADVQQPFNLHVPGGVSSIGSGGTVYDVSYMQLFQGDPLRGYGNPPNSGRRLLARPMHAAGSSQAPGAPSGAVTIAPDGSMAALVPARQAMTWQLTDPNGNGVVRERNWLSFQSGEIRVCASCHGINTQSQTGAAEPTNAPQALHDLLAEWKLQNPAGSPGPTNTVTPTRTSTPSPTATIDQGGGSVCSSGIAITKARLRAKLSSATLVARGSAVIPKPWLGVSPDTNGVRITIVGGLDITVPGGTGWTSSGGKRWRFRDPDGVNGGITRVDINDRSAMQNGMLTFSLRINGIPSVPAAGALDLSVRFGNSDECATAHWNGPAAPSPRCYGSTASLACS